MIQLISTRTLSLAVYISTKFSCVIFVIHLFMSFFDSEV